MPKHIRTSSLMLATLSLLAGTALAEVTQNKERNLYFGETHMHTAYSLDAFIGGTRQTPSDAYRAAKGETVIVNGQPHKVRRPLDFAAVTDHAEYLGEMYSALNADAPGHDNPLIQQLLGLQDIKQREQWFFKYVISNNRGDEPGHTDFYAGVETEKSGWQISVDAAEAHYQPGVFTTLVAYEWSAAPKGGNLHRNVIFRGDSFPEKPMSYIDINREEGLWRWLQELEQEGIRGLAIPHNSNASKGMMFPDQDSSGDPIDLEYAQMREHFERAIEMMQVKGNSEVHRQFWAADEFSDFENADSIQNSSGRTFAKGNFVRSGITKGLAFQQQLGVNPFKLGFTGGTDSHNGMMSDVDEDNFVGAHGPEDGSVKARREGSVTGWIDSKDLSIGSLTAVWATGNTREAIWDAMHARETYATSGPRMALRFFGGWRYADDIHTRADVVKKAYRGGVPMGGSMQDAPRGKAPRFVVMANKDALGANLDRIQIVKGWVDASGELHDQVFDVVWAGVREPTGSGKLPALGNTVDLATATYRNTIGSAQLATVWQDPEFDPEIPALYYARVIEIPTPRWTTYDAVRAGLPLLADVPATIQERAWSSPIWYTP
ncbi:DUF3604 domain-containing protein [Halieaceae bacterium IMCC14734]|uniref:DUF3604 domain-containing protein n=1 Tax=Candidatus Litorirhabdus singularis TaxID=2518993 RepID=A0ABT3TCM0_9GAMM|nr:DUF3604 domain-containing protein [Candidatus Litorirhabdus singularis]MCX2979580.1 DUF3604 domain-containing protein [Candidatus Litorirhabdus singularis]